MNRRKEGAYYENLVAEYLKTQGYEILEKNYRCRIGEIDPVSYTHLGIEKGRIPNQM